MKTMLLFAAVLMITVNSTFAESFSESKKSLIIENVKNGINSENEGIRLSSATLISQLIDENIVNVDDLKGTAIPLFKMLRYDRSTDEKLTAALTLYRLGNNQGMYLLKGVSRFDDNAKVRKVAKNLYYFHNVNQN